MVKAGDKIPAATLKYADAEGLIQEISTGELTKGKKVVIYAIPGAFTPTCTKDHAPGFIKHADDLKAKGVDTIACVSVNDVFVMQAFDKSLGGGSDKVLYLADGSGVFTKAMGLELDLTGMGLGIRSQRYAALIEDGTIKTLNVEPGRA